MRFAVDHAARDIALTRSALPECLHVPIAAVDDMAIATYVGEIERVLAEGTPCGAMLVRTKEPPPLDTRLPIWRLPASAILHQRHQVWVHIEFAGYRRAYRKAFPDETIDGKVLSHALNRRMAALMGFAYVRITPNSRGCNSSSSFSSNGASRCIPRPNKSRPIGGVERSSTMPTWPHSWSCWISNRAAA